MGCRNGEDFSEKLASCSSQLFVLAKSRLKCTNFVLQISTLLARVFENNCLFVVRLGEDTGEIHGKSRMSVMLAVLLYQGLAVYLIQSLWMMVIGRKVLLKE